MAEAATVIQEEYGHSLSTIWEVGRVALQDQVVAESLEIALEPAYTDFMTAVTEMLKTDPDLRDKLDIDNITEYRVVNDQACGRNGRPNIEMVRRGKVASEQRARFQPEFKSQAVRDNEQLIIAERADQLPVGHALFCPSADPKEALRDHPEIYKDELGYKEGLMYWQFYCRTDTNTLVAGSISVDRSDETVWREILEELEVEVPEGLPADRWLSNVVIETQADHQEAEQFIKKLRAEYYRRIGMPGQRLSVTEYVKINSQVVNTIFNTYYAELGKAVYTGDNNETLQSFAHAVLQGDTSKLDPDVIRQLIRVSSSNKFDKEAGRMMDSVLRYVATEQLRKGLEPLVILRHTEQIPVTITAIPCVAFVPYEAAQLHQLLVANLYNGVQAGRSYGGCPGNIKLSAEKGLTSLLDAERQLRNLQDVYGGLDGEESEANKKPEEDCEFISKQCPICEKKNVRTTITKTHISGDCGCKVKRQIPTHSKLAA